MAVAVSKPGVTRAKQLNLRGRLRRSSVKDTEARNRPCVAKACVLGPVRVKFCLPSSHAVFVADGVHKNVSNVKNGRKYAEQLCGNQNRVFFLQAEPRCGACCCQDSSARVVVSSIMGLIILCCGCCI